MFMPLFQSSQFMDSQIDRDCGFLKSIVFDGSKSLVKDHRESRRILVAWFSLIHTT